MIQESSALAEDLSEKPRRDVHQLRALSPIHQRAGPMRIDLELQFAEEVAGKWTWLPSGCARMSVQIGARNRDRILAAVDVPMEVPPGGRALVGRQSRVFDSVSSRQHEGGVRTGTAVHPACEPRALPERSPVSSRPASTASHYPSRSANASIIVSPDGRPRAMGDQSRDAAR